MKRMLIKGILAVVLVGGGCSCQGQTSETMLQQISALEGYIRTAEKGYQLAEQGLSTIGEIKNGEFNLHSVFFGSLGSVNQAVKVMAAVDEIIALRASLIGNFSRSLQSWQQSGQLHPGELDYIGQVYQKLVSLGLEDVNALLDLTTDERLQMDDGERMQQIEQLDAAVRQQYGLARAFSDHTNVLVLQRTQEAADINRLKALYGF